MNPPDFDSMNEMDVRETIVRPLLTRLGYAHGTEANIRTEVMLKYDKAFLGRKNPSRDPPLSGRADYVCDAIPYGRWVVEVKGPNEKLTTHVREQTHTYAAHPEIAAAFFLLTNGRRFELYRTAVLGEPILAWEFQETEERFLSLLNLVSPAAIEKLANLVRPDPGKPLGIGLASALRIVGGNVRYDEHTGPTFLTDAINGLSLPITGGFVRRMEDGQIHAHVEVGSAAAMMQSAMRLDEYDFYCTSEYISSDMEVPSIFQNFEEVSNPKGSVVKMPGLPPTPSPFGFKMKAFTEAIGFVEGNRFTGTMRLDYDLSITGLEPMMRTLLERQFNLKLPQRAEMQGLGTFDLELAPAT